MVNSEKLIDKAKDAVDSGNIEKARELIHKVNNHLKNPEALYILALCHAMKSEFSVAENLFSKSISLSRPNDNLLTKLGLTQHNQQKIPQAIKSYIAAIDLNPNNYDALSNVAVCFDYRNEDTNAIKYADKAYALNNNNPDIINIIAKHKLYSGDIKNAIQLYSQSLNLQPQQPYIYVQLSHANFLYKEYDTAENILKQAIAKFPESPYLINSIGNFYANRNRHNEAIDAFEQVLKLNENNTVSIAAKARSLITLQHFNLASDLLTKAKEKFEDNPEINAEFCNYLLLIKDYEAAYNISNNFISNICATTDIPISIAISHSTACRLTKRLDEALKTLTAIINRNDVSHETLETVQFTLADALDNLKQYDEAFLSYKIANEISPRPSDIDYYESILSELSNTIDRNFLDTIGSSGNMTPLPVFIVGMPRSGTSLVEQIISSHPEVYGAGELTDLWKIGNTISQAMNMLEYTKNFFKVSTSELKDFSETYINKLTELSKGQSRVTDKLPHNFMHIGLIECLFPNAKIIHCQRHPFDTCLSIYFRQLNDNNVYARNLEEIARFYKKYIDLMEHWYEVSSLSLLTVKYEDMVINQEVQSKHLIEHIELDWDKDVLNYFESDRIIMTPSSHQANKPIYTDSMHRWKNYSKHIKPLIKILGEPEQYI